MTLRGSDDANTWNTNAANCSGCAQTVVDLAAYRSKQSSDTASRHPESIGASAQILPFLSPHILYSDSFKLLDSRYSLASRYTQLNRLATTPAQLIELCQQGLRTLPDHPILLGILAGGYLQARHLQQAKDSFEALITLTKHNSSPIQRLYDRVTIDRLHYAYVGMARVLKDMNHLHYARYYCRLALALNYDCLNRKMQADTLQLTADIDRAKGDCHPAIAQRKRALFLYKQQRLVTEQLHSQLKLSQDYQQAKKTDLALLILQKTLITAVETQHSHCLFQCCVQLAQYRIQGYTPWFSVDEQQQITAQLPGFIHRKIDDVLAANTKALIHIKAEHLFCLGLLEILLHKPLLAHRLWSRSAALYHQAQDISLYTLTIESLRCL